MNLIGLNWIAAGVAGMLGAYAFWLEPYRLGVTHTEIKHPRLPNALDGFTLCHLSDTHLSRFGRLERKLARVLSSTEMDICAITGDIVNRPSGVIALRRILEAAKPKLGFYAVLGNNDYKAEMEIETLIGELENSGVRVLRNSHVSLSIGRSNIAVIGVDDPFTGLDNLELAMAGIPNDTFRILLAHSPDVALSIENKQIDLVLAGHTHGGQVRVFGMPLWLHCRHRLGISDGWFGPEELSRRTTREMDGVHMYVSRGIASTLIRVRLGCPPEVGVIKLQSATEKI